jgi:hypothetical protein
MQNGVCFFYWGQVVCNIDDLAVVIDMPKVMLVC